ncbi:hypothetical protein [Bacillus anthracis]
MFFRYLIEETKFISSTLIHAISKPSLFQITARIIVDVFPK